MVIFLVKEFCNVGCGTLTFNDTFSTASYPSGGDILYSPLEGIFLVILSKIFTLSFLSIKNKNIFSYKCYVRIKYNYILLTQQF